MQVVIKDTEIDLTLKIDGGALIDLLPSLRSIKVDEPIGRGWTGEAPNPWEKFKIRATLLDILVRRRLAAQSYQLDTAKLPGRPEH
jgi:hypothetical protein